MNSIGMRIANRLVELREENNVTQAELVARGRFSMATLNGVERHGLYPGEVTRKRLALTLSVITGKNITEDDIWPDMKGQSTQ